MADPYSVLGLKRGAADEEIRQAYRQMARRWHPDRFPAGPERMWAEKKMAEINEAHTAILEGSAARSADPVRTEAEQLRDIEKLMDDGQLCAARQALMRVESRCAQWNYLFGAVLMRLGEIDKAILYYGIAQRQKPENDLYRKALSSAESLRTRQKGSALCKRILSGARRLAVR